MKLIWTSEDYRNHLDTWRAKNGETKDSDYWVKPRSTNSMRKPVMAKTFQPLLAWRDLIEPSLTIETSLLKNDRDALPRDKDGRIVYSLDRHIEIRPSIEEIEKAIDQYVTDGDAEFGYGKVPGSRKPYQTYRIGSLRFQTEDGSEVYPRGSLIAYNASSSRHGTRPSEVARRPRGAKGTKGASESTRFIASLLNALPRGSNAGTNDNRAALPALPANAAELFMGNKIGSSNRKNGAVGPSEEGPGPQDWQERKETRDALLAGISPADTQVLDMALTASSMRHLGEQLGYSGKNAERQGKRHLQRATENLAVAVIEMAA